MQDDQLAISLSSWLVNDTVVAVEGLQSEYTRKIAEIKADKVFKLTMVDGSLCILHVEIQGSSSHRDMPLRMFDYISRIIAQEGRLDIRIYSVVIYVGEGAGKHDNGVWDIGKPAIGSFEYRAIKLWQLEGQDLLDMHDPYLLTLMPQVHLSAPKQQMQTAMKRIHQMDDKEEAKKLLHIMSALAKKKGLKAMVDMFISKEEMMNAPPIFRDSYLKGLEEGRKNSQIESIIQILDVRFTLTSYDQQAIQSLLRNSKTEQFPKALSQAVTLPNLTDFQNWLVS